MADHRIPDALEMKALKYGDRPEAERDRVATALAAAGRHAEAILLYEGRGDHPFLLEEKRWAVEEGASFHLVALRRLGTPVSDEDLRVCGQAAERRGRWMDAHRCWTLLEDAEGLARVAPHLPEGMRPEEEEDAEESAEEEG